MVEITASYPAGKTDTTKDNLLAAAEGEHEEWNLLILHLQELPKKKDLKMLQLPLKQ